MTRSQHVVVLGADVTTRLEKKREQERVHQFLMGLHEDGYGTVRSNILSTEPVQNLNRVYAMVVQQERVRTMTRTKEERGNPMSFAVQASGRNSGGMEKTRPWFTQIVSGRDMMLIAAFNGLVIRNGGATGHAQPQVAAVVDMVPSMVLVEDEDAEGLLEQGSSSARS